MNLTSTGYVIANRSLPALRRLCGTILVVGLSMASTVWGDDPSAEQIQFFERRIRPVLIEHCYECHSAEAAKHGKLRGGLRLDSRQAMRRGGESGAAVVPKQPENGTLLGALRYESFEMPPRGKLPDKVLADFEKWIQAGAADPREESTEPIAPIKDAGKSGKDFWSFQPLASWDPSAQPARGASRINWYIAEQQQRMGVSGNPVATARTLIRRTWFDLLGLPPTPSDLATWLPRLTNASAPHSIDFKAYQVMLDHLLASPHYGERWARHWMDVARFAESHGYEQDYDRPHAYPYRDFLIQAFNQDLPYDQFVQWQLAGDELEPDNPLALMATGFLGAGAFPTQLTEAEFESARYDELDDMVATTGVAFLGLSLGCARCHDHKYDPITMREYYRFAAHFSRTIRTEVELDLQPAANQQRRRQYELALDDARDALSRFEAQVLPERFRGWLSKENVKSVQVSPWSLFPGEATSSAGSKFVRQADGSFLAVGTAPQAEVIRLEGELPWAGLAALRIEALADPSLPRQGPGRASNGNFALGDVQLRRVPAEAGQQPTPIRLVRAAATYQQNDSSLSVAASIDDDPVSGWAVDGRIGQSQAAVFYLDPTVELRQGDRLQLTLVLEHPNGQHTLGRFRVSLTDRDSAPVQVGDAGAAEAVVSNLQKLLNAADESSAAWQASLQWFKTTLPEWQTLKAAVATLEQQGPRLQLSKVMICSEGLPHLKHNADGRGFPHFYPEVHLLRRGDPEQKVEIADPGFVSVLLDPATDATQWHVAPPAESWRTTMQRARLARWLTDDKRGAGSLAARVMVNRLWQHHFGRGLVATPNDFGLAGEPPTHPELLDYLAAELIAGDWKLKRIHKLIMTSDAYMQSTAFDNERQQRDPDNLSWWRRASRRLEAEAIRDAMLVASAQLDPTLYGKGTLDPNMRRRSIYFFIKRSQLIPMMMLFDWPEHLVSIGRRANTTIAPQALLLMNSPQVRAYATALANLPEVRDADGAEAAVQALYQRCYGRTATTAEARLALSFVTQQEAAYQDASNRNRGKLAREQAWADLAQTLLGSSEFVYVD